jgi:hypothetical protein
MNWGKLRHKPENAVKPVSASMRVFYAFWTGFIIFCCYPMKFFNMVVCDVCNHFESVVYQLETHVLSESVYSA